MQVSAHLSVHVPDLLLFGHAGKQLLLVIADEDVGRLCRGVKQHAEVAASPLRYHLLDVFIHSHERAIYTHPGVMLPYLYAILWVTWQLLNQCCIPKLLVQHARKMDRYQRWWGAYIKLHQAKPWLTRVVH